MEDKEYKALMKKVYRLIEKADEIGYEFSDLEVAIIKRISHAGTMNNVFADAYHSFNHVYERVVKGKSTVL